MMELELRMRCCSESKSRRDRRCVLALGHLDATLRGAPEICLKTSLELKPDANHELKLARQPGPGIRRRFVVVVVVEIHGRGDDAESSGSVQKRRGMTWRSIVSQIEAAGVAELNVIEDIECLHGEFHGGALRQLPLLGKREIDLPAAQGAQQAVWGVSIPKEVSVGVLWRSLKRSGIDQRHAVAPASPHSHGHSGDEVGTLAGLIVAVREKVRIRKSRERRASKIPVWIYVLAEIHLNS